MAEELNIPVTIARIEMKLDSALESVRDHQRSTKETLDDHEERLRAGERWRWALPLTMLCALAGAGAGWANLIGR